MAEAAAGGSQSPRHWAMGMLLIALCYGELAARRGGCGVSLRAEFSVQCRVHAAGTDLYASRCARLREFTWLILRTYGPSGHGNAYTCWNHGLMGSIATGLRCAHRRVRTAGDPPRPSASRICDYGSSSSARTMAALRTGANRNLHRFSEFAAQPLTNGVLWIFATCAFFLNAGRALCMHEERGTRRPCAGRERMRGRRRSACSCRLIIAADGCAMQRCPGDCPCRISQLTAGACWDRLCGSRHIAAKPGAQWCGGSRLLFAQRA